mmetsp:Transcript_11866/g.18310  ORF Transcript_11866/g.18310 Transcript_11866/m.18310 type:complete len:107 (+) Transcript_11866:507-827(+)
MLWTIVSSVLVMVFGATFAFTFFMYRINLIGTQIVAVEQEQAKKHERMFNALRDGIILAQDNREIFQNCVAKKMFDREPKVLDSKRFYLYHFFNSDRGTSEPSDIS